MHPSSALNYSSLDWVVYHSQIVSTKNYIRINSRIKPQWLVEVCPRLYLTFNSELENSRRDKEMLNSIGYKKSDPRANDWRLNRRERDISKLNN